MICSICIACFAVILVALILCAWFPKRKSLHDDVILVTGAGHGIGRILCVELSKHCKKVIAWDINEKALEETSAMVKAETGVIIKCQLCDVSNPDDVNNRVADLQSEFGRVTILINNAGVVIGNYLMQLPREKFEKMMRINLFAPFYTTQAVLPGMLGSAYEKALLTIPKALQIPSTIKAPPGVNSSDPPKGHVVFMASVAGVVPIPGMGDYCASKAGLIMLSDSLRFEMKKMGVGNQIAVTDIRPYFINTGMFDGAYTRVPFLFSILKQEEVVKRVIEAIQREDTTVYIPWHSCILPLMVHFTPRWLFSIIWRLTGTESSMDNFKHADVKPDSNS